MAGMPYPPNLWKSVKSVGEYFPRSRFCGFCEFCGRIGRGRRGYGKMPYPPKRGLGFSPKPTLQPHFEYWVADDKLSWGIGGDKVFLCERFLQTCDIGSGAKTVFF